jgi:outer membrane receptor protein involved in Fe transport
VHASASWLDESRTGGSPLRRNSIELGTVQAGARWRASPSDDVALTLFGSKQTFRSTFSTEAVGRATEEPSLDQFDVPAWGAGASAQWSHRATSAHELTVGADLFRVDGEVNEDFRLVNGQLVQRRRVGGEQLLWGAYAQDVIRPAERVRLLASARYDIARRSGGFRRETNLQTDALLIDTAYVADAESTFNFSVGARWDVSERLAARASGYRAYRSPTLNELYKPFREPGNVLTEGNADLNAERIVGIEVGADYAIGSRALVRGTVFWARIRDPIVEATVAEAGGTSRVIQPCGFVPAGGVCRQRRNLESLRTTGIELELQIQPAAAWTLSSSYLWNPTRIGSGSSNPELEGKHGARSPEHAFTGSLRWADPALADISFVARWVGRRYEDDLNSLPLASFFVLDGRAERAIGARWRLFAAVENLFDNEYETSRALSGLVRVGGPRLLRGGIRVAL